VSKRKELVDSLKADWKQLWKERMDDKVRAEGIAINDYLSLFVDKGTVVHATRDFKALSFREILDKHQVDNADLYVAPSPSVGGWAKFVKNSIRKQPQSERVQVYRAEKKKVKQQPKKSGRGWLHK
jgi:hypothetical protein